MYSDVVIAVLDCLIPGDTDGWPAAGEHGLAPKMLELLETLSVYGRQQLAIFLSQLPENFPALSTEEQIEILRSASSSHANRILKQDDSLMAGLPIDPVTERKFNDAGFGYTSEEFRARLERTLELHILAEEYGFL